MLGMAYKPLHSTLSISTPLFIQTELLTEAKTATLTQPSKDKGICDIPKLNKTKPGST